MAQFLPSLPLPTPVAHRIGLAATFFLTSDKKKEGPIKPTHIKSHYGLTVMYVATLSVEDFVKGIWQPSVRDMFTDDSCWSRVILNALTICYKGNYMQ
ncbi:hypothetical protein AVEN_237739-1 [Araneus ventricosus]|uniref:Uncharacterized protein n=1 Tax=Araneus ventricosus TaxID=182803 RepID=A0A4Y2VHI8_ARAVE|nr:hypothetical protein AVEN_237739-1 [Araneus ventricosus]